MVSKFAAYIKVGGIVTVKKIIKDYKEILINWGDRAVKEAFSMLAFNAQTYEYRSWDVMLRLYRTLNHKNTKPQRERQFALHGKYADFPASAAGVEEACSAVVPVGLEKLGSLSQLPLGLNNPGLLRKCSAQMQWDLKGVVVTLSDGGHLQCSYLGTDPSFFQAPKVESRELDYDEMDKEMKELLKVIREATKSQ
eukprot:g40261.t1